MFYLSIFGLQCMYASANESMCMDTHTYSTTRDTRLVFWSDHIMPIFSETRLRNEPEQLKEIFSHPGFMRLLIFFSKPPSASSSPATSREVSRLLVFRRFGHSFEQFEVMKSSVIFRWESIMAIVDMAYILCNIQYLQELRIAILLVD